MLLLLAQLANSLKLRLYALYDTNLKESTDSSNSSVRSYLTLIFQDSIGLEVYIKVGLTFARDLCPLFLFMFSIDSALFTHLIFSTVSIMSLFLIFSTVSIMSLFFVHSLNIEAGRTLVTLFTLIFLLYSFEIRIYANRFIYFSTNLCG